MQAPVAQLDRVLPSEGRGHRFESCRARHLILVIAWTVKRYRSRIIRIMAIPNT